MLEQVLCPGVIQPARFHAFTHENRSDRFSIRFEYISLRMVAWAVRVVFALILTGGAVGVMD